MSEKINSIIIVAGGKGSRMQSTIPKQFMLLNKRPILMHTITRFSKFSPNIYVVLPPAQINYWKNLLLKYDFNIKHKIIEGGKERFFSVQNAIKHLSSDGFTAIHDGVRPMVSQITIKKCFELAQKKGNAVPFIDIHDSIRQIENDHSKTVDRDKYKRIQTPQVFDNNLIKKAYLQKYEPYFTDDASLIENLGYPVYLVEGNRENHKITTNYDLKIAEILIQSFD